MISERRLRDWRKEALQAKQGEYAEDAAVILFEDNCKKILLMTQELLDLHLLNKENKKL